MADRLTTTPKRWFLECTYCNPKDSRTNPSAERRHETELLQKAKRLCKNHTTNHFLDYVTSELDTLDHSILTPITMIEILTQIHTTIKCDCLTNTTQEIEQLTKSNQYVTIPLPQAYAIPATSPAQKPTAPKLATTPAKRPAKTLLERLQNGKNTTPHPRKI